MSCAVMRARLPALLTLPSRTAPTCSCAPIFSMGSFLPLKANDDVRAATCKPDTFDSAVIKSSVMPSLKYSFSLSELILTNGNTATDFLAAGHTTADGDALGVCGTRAVSHHTRTAMATPQTVAITPTRSVLFPVAVGPGGRVGVAF